MSVDIFFFLSLFYLYFLFYLYCYTFLAIMSSLKNAVRQRQHRERGQLASRERLGLLEKHKDYVLRAKDHHFKEKRLTALKQKAFFKNPDEFYFKMINAQTKNGVHVLDNRSKQLPEEMQKLIKSQNLNYITHARNIDKKKIDRLQGELQFIGITDTSEDVDDIEDMRDVKAMTVKPKHTVFVDDEEQARNFNAAKHFNTAPQLMDRRFNRLTLDQLKTETIQGLTGHELKEARRERASKYRELESRLDRDSKLSQVEREVIIQRNLKVSPITVNNNDD
ncbi:small-subunit processome [Syncephalis plumigaleata]|nr:small-subunit processome [Syncephalis plumigaleata]